MLSRPFMENTIVPARCSNGTASKFENSHELIKPFGCQSMDHLDPASLDPRS